MNVYLLSVLLCASVVSASLSLSDNRLYNLARRKKDFPSLQADSGYHRVSECVLVTSQGGHFFYKSPGKAEVCGIYFITDPNKLVEITVKSADVSCRSGGLITLFDGWELSGEFFPNDYDLPMNSRFTEFCDSQETEKVFVSHQNAAMIMYKVPKRGEGFTISVKYIMNDKPCNVLFEGTAPFYTLRNHGQAENCSLVSLFPASVQVLDIDVGTNTRTGVHKETGTLRKCSSRGSPDFAQLGGSHTIDNSKQVVADSVCGLDSVPNFSLSILCGVTSVRLVSSGDTENALSVSVQPLDLDNPDMDVFTCPI